jgi:hypothetical protein
MNPRIRIAELAAAVIPKKRELKKLIDGAAAAFGYPPPSIRGHSFDDALELFAHFTRACVGRAVDRGDDLNAVRARLFAFARATGESYRERLGVSTTADLMRAARLLYKMLRIDFDGGAGRGIAIRSCFFSRHYSADVCRVISALDEGLMAGLSGGGSLIFSSRITEGFHECTAEYRPAGSED